MTFTPVKPLDTAPKSTGVSISLNAAPNKKRTPFVRVTMTRDGQIATFDRHINPDEDRFDVMQGGGPDEGKLMLRLHKDGEFKIRSSAKGSVYFKAAPWSDLPKDDRPTASCEITADPTEDETAGTITNVIELPDWAKPSKRGGGGRMDQEFGLKGTVAKVNGK